MTAYFDDKGSSLGEIERGDLGHKLHNALRKWEEELVFDVTIAAEMPAMPERFRLRIHECVLKYAVETLPLNAPAIDLEDYGEHIRRLSNLQYDLHTIFHAITTETELSDTPTYSLGVLYAKGEEFREELIEKEKS